MWFTRVVNNIVGFWTRLPPLSPAFKGFRVLSLKPFFIFILAYNERSSLNAISRYSKKRIGRLLDQTNNMSTLFTRFRVLLTIDNYPILDSLLAFTRPKNFFYRHLAFMESAHHRVPFSRCWIEPCYTARFRPTISPWLLLSPKLPFIFILPLWWALFVKFLLPGAK